MSDSKGRVIMSDVSKTNELTAMRDRLAAEIDPGDDIGPDAGKHLADWLIESGWVTGEPGIAPNVPVWGEPNDDREHLARLLAAQGGEEWDRLVGTAEYARNRYLRKAGAILDRMPSISRATVPDATTERFKCDQGCDEVGAAMEDCSAHGRTPRDLWEQLDKAHKAAYAALAERDTALAAIERVRAIHANAGPSQGYDSRFKGGYGMLDDCCAACGSHGEYGVEWPCPTVAALDVVEKGK